MAAVSLELTQSGSGSTSIHAEPGDTITLELAETVFNNMIGIAVATLNAALEQQTGVSFAVNTAGGAS